MATDTKPALQIIDFSPFYGSDTAARQSLVDQVRAACLDKGFFQLINHNIPSSLQDSIFTLAQEFFALPMEDKMLIDKDKNTHHRGYETFHSQAFSGSTQPDLKEAVDFGPDLPPSHPHVLTHKVACGPNYYPSTVSNPAEFKRVVDEYFALAMGLAEDVLRVLALGLGLQEEELAELSREPCATVKMLHYPPQTSEERGIGAHTDFGFVTLLMQDDAGGLQVFDKTTETWIDVPPIPHAYVINLGDCLRRLTNDTYHSGLHQVINKSGRSRFSVACFHAGNPNFVVRPLSVCCDGKEPKYPPVLVDEYVAARYDDSYGRAAALKA